MKIEGLKINILGDSITAGSGASSPDKCFVSVLCSKYGAAARNYGIGGTRISKQQQVSPDPKWDLNFCDRVAAMDDDADLVLIFGGSLGAEKLTEAVYDLWKEASDPRLHFLHIRGRSAPSPATEDERHRTLAYADHMPSLMQAADLVICRAGAMTLTELAACGKASVLIPSPNVTDNHQYKNARALSDCGAAVMICEDELSGKRLAECVSAFLAFPDRRRRMEEISRSRCKADTNVVLLREMLRLSDPHCIPSD